MTSIVTRALGAIGKLLRRRVLLIAVLVLLAVAAGYGVCTFLGGSSQTALDAGQRVLTVRSGVLTREVSIDGSIDFPNKETLTFASRGLVDEILVSEGEEVKEGQPLASLDDESIAALRQAAAQAELDLLEAQDDLAVAENPTLRLAEATQVVTEARAALYQVRRELDTLLDPPAHMLAQATAAVTEAKSAGHNAWRELDALLNPSEYEFVQAKGAVVDAQAALEDARERLTGDRDDAQVRVDDAQSDLDAARRLLRDAGDTSGHQDNRKAVADAERAYADAVRKWTGADLTADELALSPSALFESWRFDPAAVFGRAYDPFAGGTPADDPATRWNELTLFSWTFLYPAPGSIRAACDDSDVLPVGVQRGESQCVQRELEDAWEPLEAARNALERVLVQHGNGVADAKAAATRAERSLADAEEALSEFDVGPRAALLWERQEHAEAGLAKAEADLAALSAPDPVEVETRRGRATLADANLAQAEADLAALSTPDPVEVETKRGRIAVAGANLAEAETELARMSARRELEVTLRETAVVSAQANLDGAVARLDNSTLKAPWDGYVSEIMVEQNEEINAVDPVLVVIDYGVARVVGRVDEFEVLSLERGVAAAVKVDALPDQTLKGVVSKIDADSAAERGVVTFSVDVDVVLPEGVRLQEGMRATAKVVLGEERGLLVPSPAIRGEYERPTVLVVDGDETEERPVVLGSSDGFWTVVREGLAENERIAIEVGRPGEGAFRTDVGFGEPPDEEDEAETIVVEEP